MQSAGMRSAGITFSPGEAERIDHMRDLKYGFISADGINEFDKADFLALSGVEEYTRDKRLARMVANEIAGILAKAFKR